MKNWIIVLLIFVIPLGLYGYLDCVAQEDNSVTAQNIAALENNTPMQSKMSAMPTLYKFSSPMCGDCKKVAKEMAPLKDKWKGKIIFNELNVSGSEGESQKVRSMIEEYKITTVPTLIFMDKNGKFVKKVEGFQTQSQIDTAIKNVVEAQ